MQITSTNIVWLHFLLRDISLYQKNDTKRFANLMRIQCKASTLPHSTVDMDMDTKVSLASWMWCRVMMMMCVELWMVVKLYTHNIRSTCIPPAQCFPKKETGFTCLCLILPHQHQEAACFDAVCNINASKHTWKRGDDGDETARVRHIRFMRVYSQQIRERKSVSRLMVWW